MKEVVKIRDLEYAYPDGTKALKGINATVLEGESIALIGPNGAGKSTLLLHLNGILRGKGRVEVAQTEISAGNAETVREKIGLVFQDPDDQLFMPTVFDDVAFGPINLGWEKEKVIFAVKRALGEVDMLDSIERVSHHLSFGEKKKAALATVLSMQPEILILDEPSSNLDPRARRHLIEVLRNLSITKIIAGHDLELDLAICNKAILLDGGEIIAAGGIEEILGDKLLMESHGLEVPLSLQLGRRRRAGADV